MKIKSHFCGIFILLIYLCISSTYGEQNNFTLDQLQTLNTFKKIDESPLFEMRYSHDYNFDKFLKKGITSDFLNTLRISSNKENKDKFACTCFASLNVEGNKIFGRNFDWYKHPALILFTNPPDAYKSVSIVDLHYLGYIDDNEIPSEEEKKRLMEVPFWPYDGMNEHGLGVGMMAVSHAEDRYDPKKLTIFSIHLIRLMLDYAKDVEGALSLLENYNILFRTPLHFFVADASGHSAVIEFKKGKRYILRNHESYQVSTNFVISDVALADRKDACWRYRKASNMLDKANGKLNEKQAMNVLKNVSKEDTLWSAVYNLTTRDIFVTMGKNYNKVYKFNIRDK